MTELRPLSPEWVEQIMTGVLDDMAAAKTAGLITTDNLQGPADVLFEQVIKRTNWEPKYLDAAMDLQMARSGMKGKPLATLGECLVLVKMIERLDNITNLRSVLAARNAGLIR